MPVMRVFYTFYIHSSFHLCNSFIRVIRDFNIRGMTTNCSTSSVTGQIIRERVKIMPRLLLLILISWLGIVCAVGQPGNLELNALTIHRYRGQAVAMAEKFGRAEKDRFEIIYQTVIQVNKMNFWQEHLAYLRAQAYVPYIDEETKAEMQAFAKASGLSYQKVLLVNCFYDMICQGCRQAAVWGKKTTDGNLFHARNLDWRDWGSALRDNNVLLVRRYPLGNAVATLTWPGFLGCLTGCNDKGLTIAYNQLLGKNSVSGEPVFLMLKRILRWSSTLAEAITAIKKSFHCTNGSLMLSSARENVAAVVVIKNNKVWIRHAAGENFVVNNNNCYFDEAGEISRKHYRRCPLYQVVKNAGVLQSDKLQKVMANPRVLMSCNLLTAIFALSQNRIYLSCGRYYAARGPYKALPVFDEDQAKFLTSQPPPLPKGESK